MTETFRKSDKNHKEAKPENKFQVCIYLYKKEEEETSCIDWKCTHIVTVTLHLDNKNIMILYNMFVRYFNVSQRLHLKYHCLSIWSFFIKCNALGIRKL